MWRSFFLAIGAYCCLLGVEALAIERAVLKVDASERQYILARNRPARLGPLEPDGRRRRRHAVFVHDPPTRERRLIGRLYSRPISPLRSRRGDLSTATLLQIRPKWPGYIVVGPPLRPTNPCLSLAPQTPIMDRFTGRQAARTRAARFVSLPRRLDSSILIPSIEVTPWRLSPSPRPRHELTSGADILVQSLVNHGVDTIFAYPGGASMPLHQALTRFSDQLRTILPRHEQGGAFAAQGIARSTGKVGVCMATSGPGATNLVTAIADAKLDSIPLIAITGQVPTHVDRQRRLPGNADRRSLPRHHQAPLPGDRRERHRPRREGGVHHRHDRPAGPGADRHAQGRPARQDRARLRRRARPARLPRARTRKAKPEQIKQIAAAIKLAKRPIIYAGGGIISADASDELRTLAKKTGIPVTMTVMGLGAFPSRRPAVRSTCSACTARCTPTTRSTRPIC